MYISEVVLAATTIAAAAAYFYQKSKFICKDTDLNHSKEYIVKLQSEINDLKKKSKVSSDVIEVLADLKRGGAVLRVERMNQDDIFYHNGSQYR
jgi:hypothetical protein